MRYNLYLSKIAFTLFFTGLFFCANAQTADTPANKRDGAKTCYWVNAQLGTGTYDLNIGAEAGVIVHYDYLIALKAEGDGNFNSDYTSRRNAGMIGLLFGRELTHGKYFNVTASAGVGAVFFETRGDYINVRGTDSYGPNKDFTQMGVPIELKLWANPLPVLGFTLTTGVNITPHETFYNVGLGVAIGKLRAINFLRRKHAD